MAVTINRGAAACSVSSNIASGTGATHLYSKSFENDLKDSSGDFIFDRSFALEDYSLTVASGNLDIDLYDLGSIDLGAGAGEDALGLTHANAKIHLVAIQNKEIAGGGTLRIDGGVTGHWTGILPASATLDLPQGGFLVVQFGDTGSTVTDTTSHMLRLSAQTTDCEINFVFFSSQT
jgi:hypothetical protein